jgi:cytoskeletal protein RodZ
METLGVWLRQTRESRDETLRDVEAATRIRVRFLDMLEAGEFDALPGGEVQVRGFLRIYARHLELAPEQVLARYDREVLRVEPVSEAFPADPSTIHQPSPPAKPVRPVDIPVPPQSNNRPPASFSIPQWLSLETLVITCIVLIILLLIAIAVLYVVSLGQDRAGAIDPVVATATVQTGAVLLSTRTPTPLSPTPTFPVDPEGYVMVSLVSTEHVWARIRVDGRTAFEGMMEPGQEETRTGREAVVVETGNGAGLLVTVNGQMQGTVGERAEACMRSWGPKGETGAP